MNEKDPVSTPSGSKQDEAKPASSVTLSSLVDKTAAILTALKSETPSVQSAVSPLKISTNFSSQKEENLVNQTTEVVTKTKKGTKTMKTKVKATKMQTMKRMLARLDKVKTFERLEAKMTRWLVDEKDIERRTQLETLRDRLNNATVAQNAIRGIVNGLADGGYVPPKKNFSGTSQLEHGRQVWIKPKFLEAYTVSMPKEQLDNLFVDKVVGGKVVVCVGDPNEAVAIRFPVSKLQLQVTNSN